jgi:hypothetical protein
MAGRAMFALVAMLAAALEPPPVTEVAMRAATDRLAAEVGAVRRIQLRGPFDRHLVTREEARAETERVVTAAVPGSRMAGEERILMRLGLLPPGSDYARLLADSYGERPAAAYDAGARRLYVPDWIPLDRQRATLAHEIAHALADQRFGLRRLLQIEPDGRHRLDRDAELARQALIEGDATTTALELVDPRGVFLGTRELAATSERLRAAALAAGPKGERWDPWIRNMAMFTQVDGLLFVARARARQSWAAVNELWATPPASTEQVLHPEKYDAREPPVPVDAAPLAALGPRLTPAAVDVVGELGVRAWLAKAVSPEVAERAAAGWGGDRAVLYVPPPAAAGAPEAPPDAGPPSEPALAWLTVWDDPVDAEDFARNAPTVLARLAGEPQPVPLDEHGRSVLRAASGLYALAWRHDAVAVLIAAPDGAEGALGEMLDGWRRGPARPARRRVAGGRDR